MTTASAPTPTRDSAIAGWLPPPGGHRTMDPPPEPLFLTLARGLDRLAGHRAWRRATLGALELGIALLAALAALLIVNGAQRGPWWGEAAWPAAFLVLAKVVAGVFTGALGCRWRFVGLRDALLVLRSTVVAAAAGLAGIAWLDPAGDGLRLVVADAALYLLLSGGLRLSARWLHQRERRVRAVTGNQLRRTVIVGAGEAGALLLERMLASPKMLMDPVALVDDDANMHGSRLRGVPIVGPVSELGAIADRLGADETIIAVPSASTEQMARIVDSCVAAGLPFRIAPDPEDMLGMHPGTSGLRDLRPSDLLGRAQQEFDVAPVRAELRQARVVITGAAGSILSELARP